MLLQQALLTFPEVIGPLIQKANERKLGQKQWKNVMESEYFIRAKMRRNENNSIAKLCKIYSETAHALWNNEDLLQWVYKHCVFVLDRLENPRSFALDESGDELV